MYWFIVITISPVCHDWNNALLPKLSDIFFKVFSQSWPPIISDTTLERILQIKRIKMIRLHPIFNQLSPSFHQPRL
jgi:hypothetical protein